MKVEGNKIVNRTGDVIGEYVSNCAAKNALDAWFNRK